MPTTTLNQTTIIPSDVFGFLLPCFWNFYSFFVALQHRFLIHWWEDETTLCVFRIVFWLFCFFYFNVCIYASRLVGRKMDEHCDMLDLLGMLRDVVTCILCRLGLGLKILAPCNLLCTSVFLEMFWCFFNWCIRRNSFFPNLLLGTFKATLTTN